MSGCVAVEKYTPFKPCFSKRKGQFLPILTFHDAVAAELQLAVPSTGYHQGDTEWRTQNKCSRSWKKLNNAKYICYLCLWHYEKQRCQRRQHFKKKKKSTRSVCSLSKCHCRVSTKVIDKMLQQPCNVISLSYNYRKGLEASKLTWDLQFLNRVKVRTIFLSPYLKNKLEDSYWLFRN